MPLFRHDFGTFVSNGSTATRASPGVSLALTASWIEQRGGLAIVVRFKFGLTLGFALAGVAGQSLVELARALRICEPRDELSLGVSEHDPGAVLPAGHGHHVEQHGRVDELQRVRGLGGTLGEDDVCAGGGAGLGGLARVAASVGVQQPAVVAAAFRASFEALTPAGAGIGPAAGARSGRLSGADH